MRKRKAACLDIEMERLSTEQLDDLLQRELQKEKPDENVVLPILHVLRRRETHTPEGMEDTAGAPENCQRPRVNTRSWVVKAAAVVAVAALFAMVIPFAGNASSTLDALYRITDSVIEFFRPGNKDTKSLGEYVFQTDNPGLQQVYDAVVELGVTDPVVPMWLPEGYVLADLEKLPSPGGLRLHATFENEENTIVLQFKIVKDVSLSQYEKKDSVELYEVNGIYHLFYQNTSDNVVVWVLDNVECVMSAKIQVETLYEIVKSIYRRK